MMFAPLGGSERRTFVFWKKQGPQAFETVGGHAAQSGQLSQPCSTLEGNKRVSLDDFAEKQRTALATTHPVFVGHPGKTLPAGDGGKDQASAGDSRGQTATLDWSVPGRRAAPIRVSGSS